VPSLMALRGLLAVDPLACARCNGHKVLTEAVLDPALGASTNDALLLALLAALQSPPGRASVRPFSAALSISLPSLSSYPRCLFP